MLERVVPIVSWLPRYDRSWWRPDLLAGLTVWALLVPEAMAYAELAGMPPETGLYAGIGAIVGYAIFGRSRQLFVGPSSTVAILSAATVGAVATAADSFIELSIALAILVGVLFIVFGILRLGFISVFMSKPVLTGFTFGLGLTIAVGQLDKIFGVEGGSGNFFEKLWALIKELPEADLRTTAIGLVALAILLVSRKLFGHKIPMALIVVFVAIICSNALDWADKGVQVVGDIPASIPTITFPTVGISEWIDLLPGAIGIVVIGFAESYGVAQNFARKHGYEIDADRELVALGTANVGAGFLGGFTVDGSLSRSSAADDAGAKSQMAMLICGAITVITILALTPIFEQLPEAVLAAIVVSAVWGTFNIAALRRIWHANKGDFVAAIAALLGVCAIDLLPGLLVAILVSFILLIYRASRPGMPRLGLAADGSAYVSTETNPDAVEPGHVRVIRLDSQLFFANADAFRLRIQDVIDGSDPPPLAIVADFETVNLIDTDGADAVGSIVEDLEARGIGFAIARLNKQGRDALRSANVYDRIGDENFFSSVRAAVAESETD